METNRLLLKENVKKVLFGEYLTALLFFQKQELKIESMNSAIQAARSKVNRHDRYSKDRLELESLQFNSYELRQHINTLEENIKSLQLEIIDISTSITGLKKMHNCSCDLISNLQPQMEYAESVELLECKRALSEIENIDVKAYLLVDLIIY